MAEGKAPVTIIKRKKVVGGDGHHGGAWKVAYADFVTAMMAFFLLMWLLNATSEEQRKGLADYFKPTITVHRQSGGGDGPMAGDSAFAELVMAQSGTGATNESPSVEDKASGDDNEEGEAERLNRLMEQIAATSGESEIGDELLDHVRTRVTDEGLVIELFDLPDSPLWVEETDAPTRKMELLLAMIADVVGGVTNPMAVRAHMSSAPLRNKSNDAWSISADRALRSRAVLARSGLPAARFNRVTGNADRVLSQDDPFDIRNQRVEIILLRSDLG